MSCDNLGIVLEMSSVFICPLILLFFFELINHNVIKMPASLCHLTSMFDKIQTRFHRSFLACPLWKLGFSDVIVLFLKEKLVWLIRFF